MKERYDFPLKLTTQPAIYRCEDGWSWSPPPLQDYDLWYVLDGEGKMTFDFQTTALRAGVCFVIRPGDRPQATQDPRKRLVVFAAHFVVNGGFRLPERVSWVRDIPFLNTLAHHCVAAGRRGDPLGREQSRLHLQLMLLRLLQEGAEPTQSPGDSTLQEIVRDLEREPGKRWNVGTLARQAHLSRSQFTRRFTSLTGLPPNRFLVTARMARARQLIEETNMTLGQIAGALDYRDVYFFSRQFKQFAGAPPGALRKRPVTGGAP